MSKARDKLNEQQAEVNVSAYYCCMQKKNVFVFRKHVANDEKCSRLGWVCIPLSVETHGCWGEEAGRCLDRLATRIATRTGCPKSSAVSGLYGRLSIGLIRANARALLARSSSLS